MKNSVADLILKAERSLSAAKELYESGYYDFAASRAYYAIFYISEALLSTKGLSFSKHSAVLSGIYIHFVENGELSVEFHQTIIKAFDMRNDSDYLCEAPIEKEDVKSLISDVEKQVTIGVVKLTKEST